MNPSVIYWLKFSGISFIGTWFTGFLFLLAVSSSKEFSGTGNDLFVVGSFLLWIINILFVLFSLVRLIAAF